MNKKMKILVFALVALAAALYFSDNGNGKCP